MENDKLTVRAWLKKFRLNIRMFTIGVKERLEYNAKYDYERDRARISAEISEKIKREDEESRIRHEAILSCLATHDIIGRYPEVATPELIDLCERMRNSGSIETTEP
ncbi:MAG: hypothetical protein WC637_00285 [Victivallales bacterium]|jgi:hypothetical protein